jgi:hypothetical protein
MEKLCFLSDLLEPMSCHLDAPPRVAHETSLNQTPIGKRGIRIILGTSQCALLVSIPCDSKLTFGWDGKRRTAEGKEEKRRL